MMKLLLLGLMLISTSVYADNIKIKLGKLSGKINSVGLTIEQVQTKVRCVFLRKKTGGLLIRRRYPVTFFSDNSISTKKVSLTEWLPGFETRSCAVVLMVLGKDDNNKGRMGDIVLMGSLESEMSDGDLEFMQSKDAREHVLKRMENLKLGLGTVRGKSRIIEL